MQARTVLPKNNHAVWLLAALAGVGLLGLALAVVLRLGAIDGLSSGAAPVKTGVAYFEFAETADTLWIADPEQPSHRTKLFVAPHASDYGVVPSLSPDGRRVVYTSLPLQTVAPSPATPAGLWLKALDNGSKPKLIARDVDLLVRAAWSPDSSSVVFRRSEGTKGALFVMSLSDGQERLLIGDEKAGLFPVAFSRDGSMLYYVTLLEEASDLYAAPLAGGTPKLVAHLAPGLTRDWALSPDGSKMAFLEMTFEGGKIASRAKVLDIASGASDVVSGEDEDAFNPTWGPDGRLVVGRLSENNSGLLTVGAASQETQATSGFDVPLLVTRGGIVVHAFEGKSSSNPGDAVLTYLMPDGSRRTIATGEVTFLGWVTR